MNNKQKLKACRKKLNGKFPAQLGCIYYKGLRINKQMFFGKEV